MSTQARHQMRCMKTATDSPLASTREGRGSARVGQRAVHGIVSERYTRGADDVVRRYKSDARLPRVCARDRHRHRCRRDPREHRRESDWADARAASRNDRRECSPVRSGPVASPCGYTYRTPRR